MIFPLSLETLIGKPWMFVVFGLIGFGFGFILEISGFGNSKKLAAQFYFKELTVFKVMFTAIVVAMVLLFTMIGLGVVDFNLIWVNPTYLWPGIVGGLIMGVGFIIGGFCPGTSLVAAATFKLDGVFFVAGGLFGIFLFGETVGYFEQWWNSSYYGRLTIPDWLNLPTGVVVLGIVLMAIFMFWGAEQLERIYGGRDLSKEPNVRFAGAMSLVAFAIAVLLIGDPTLQDKWDRVAAAKAPVVANREVQISPGELLTMQADSSLRVILADVRPENEFNLFHIKDSKSMPLDALPAAIPNLIAQEALNTVYVVTSNDEETATEAWKMLTAESVPNAYILEGGVNQWIQTFDGEKEGIEPRESAPIQTAPTELSLVSTEEKGDSLRYIFPAALGDRYQAARPSLEDWTLEFTPKVKLELKRDKSGGGCG